jgi:hypothetical protein
MQPKKPESTLESVCRDLVAATHALAREERESGSHMAHRLKIYMSLIVTTANLKICKFDPQTISLNDGTLPGSDFQDVQFIRFRKQFSAERRTVPAVEFENDVDISFRREHTVLIARPEAVPDLLRQLAPTV